jgi:microcystin-dependent protein
MTAQSRSALKSTWAANYRPTSAAFTDLFDSFTIYSSVIENLGITVASGSLGVPQVASATSVSFFVPSSIGLALVTAATTAAVQGILGGGTVGIAIFTAATTAAAQNTLGGNTVGKQIFACTTTAQAAAIISASASTASPVPVGTTMPYAGSSAPSGWLLANGAAVSRATYADLFTAIGTTFGIGDGVSTFNVPDLRGRVPVGHDAMGSTTASRVTPSGSGITGTTLGSTGGSETVTLTTATMPSHTHSISSTVVISGGGSDSVISGCGTFGAVALATAAEGSGGAHQNMPPAIVLNYIIKHSPS